MACCEIPDLFYSVLTIESENEEMHHTQTTDIHSDHKHPAEAFYPPTYQTRHTDVCTDKTKEKNLS